jgi:hypothetical protein
MSNGAEGHRDDIKGMSLQGEQLLPILDIRGVPVGLAESNLSESSCVTSFSYGGTSATITLETFVDIRGYPR